MPALSTVIANLNAKAASCLPPLMNPFSCGGWGCPWLIFADRRKAILDPEHKRPEGLLLMQDWGNVPQTLASAVGDVDCAYRSKGLGTSDASLRNLFSVPDWHHAIGSGEWIVSNAVWGIRPQGDSKSGCLNNQTHKAAFPIWLELLTHLATFPEFKLVIAGSWGVFGKQFHPNGHLSLSAYLNRWINWVAKGNPSLHATLTAMAAKCQGTVYHVPHPAIWSNPYPASHDWRKGPI